MKIHEHIVKGIIPGSIADELGIEPGDRLLSVNGHEIEDVFDYFVRHYDKVPQDLKDISGGDPLRAVTDYVAGMTDRYARSFFMDMFVPHTWNH